MPVKVLPVMALVPLCINKAPGTPLKFLKILTGSLGGLGPTNCTERLRL